MAVESASLMARGADTKSRKSPVAGSVKAHATPLTPTQRHYLLKILVCAEIHDEFALLDEPDALLHYGQPFGRGGVSGMRVSSNKSSQNGGKSADETNSDDVDNDDQRQADRPLILLHLFHAHLRRFPGLSTAKIDYWRKQIAPIFERFDKAHFSNSAERGEVTNRKLLNLTATRYIATFWARGISVRGPGEKEGPSKDKGPNQTSKDMWGEGKEWGAGTVKRGLARPLRPSKADLRMINDLLDPNKSGAAEEDVQIWHTAAANTRRVKRDWSAWKESIIESEDGLDNTLRLLEIGSLTNLPAPYRNAAEWVRRHVAFVLWTVLVKFPGADEIFSIIKTVHGLFPYWGARQLLKIANAQTMIKAIVDMVLARPLGMVDSLGQRIFFIVMRGEISNINRKILGPLRKAIANEAACKAVDNYVDKRTKEHRARLIMQAQKKKIDFLVVVLEDQDFADSDIVRGWASAYTASPLTRNLDWAYPEAVRLAKHIPDWPIDISVPPVGSSALKFAQMKLYLRERLRRRDREEIASIGAGPMFPDAIRASLEVVFYRLFYAIAEASNLSKRLADFQAFVDDMIRVKTKKQDSLEDWIALCARHENHLYVFVHEIRDAIKPIFEWCQEALDYMALATTKPWEAANVKAPRVQVNLDSMLAEAAARAGTASADDKGNASKDAVAQAILQELADVERFVKWDKMRTEVAMRKEYALMHDDTLTSVTLVATDDGGEHARAARDLEATRRRRSRPSATTVERLIDLDGLMEGLLEGAGEQRDDGRIPLGAARGTDAVTVPWGYFVPSDVLLEMYMEDADQTATSTPLSDNQQQRRTYPINSIQVPPPTTYHIRRYLLPVFRERLRGCLPDWVNTARP